MGIKAYRGIILALGLFVLVGCGNKELGDGNEKYKDPTNNTKTVELNESSKNKYKSADEAVKSELGKIQYDLASIIESSRSVDDMKKYILVTYDKDTDNIKIEDKSKDKKSSEKGNKKPEVKPKATPELDKFISSTKLSKDSFDRVALAYNEKDGYLVGLFKCVDGKTDEVEKSIKEYIKNQANTNANAEVKANFTASKVDKHNGYIIVCIENDAESTFSKIKSAFDETDKLITDSINDLYKK